MQVYEKFTICVPIIFYEVIDEEEVGIMIEHGFSEYKAQTHQAVRSRNPKAINHLPPILSDFPYKELDIDSLYIETSNQVSKVKSQLKAFPHSVKLQNHLKSLNTQLDFYERIQTVYGVGKCKKILIIY